MLNQVAKLTRRTFQNFRLFGSLTCEKDFTQKAAEFLEILTERIDTSEHQIFDEVVYSDGVLNITMTDGRHFVVNKQTPNKQIWLSSPISGPQRFEYETDINAWIQIKTKEDLIKQLEQEFNNNFLKDGMTQVSIKVDQ